MASIHSIAHQTQTTELRACKAEVAIIMQQLSGLEWQQAIADCLPDAICWHVRKAKPGSQGAASTRDVACSWPLA